MRTFVFFALLVRQVSAMRKIAEANLAKNVEVADAGSELGVGIDKAIEAAGNSFLSMLEMLKEDPSNETLQSEYRDAVGQIVWDSAEEEASFEGGKLSSLLSSSTGEHVENQKDLRVTPLGEMSEPGEKYNVVELLDGIRKKLGRMFTHRRDYIIEKASDNTHEAEPKYVIEGNFMSLHNRMYVRDKDSNYKYVLRRSFNYLNPIARIFGQYSYRVIRCVKTSDKPCAEGDDVLFTITKDRLGRGVFWGRDQWRVFSGLGGCTKTAHGLFSCNEDKQILYSLSSGILDGIMTGPIDHQGGFGTSSTYYQGRIRTMSGFRNSTHTAQPPDSTSSAEPVSNVYAIIDDGHHVSLEELQRDYEVARSFQTSGPPRLLARGYGEPANFLVNNALGVASVSNPLISAEVKGVLNVARNLVWHDAYDVTFTKSTDSLLIFLVEAVQDLTNDRRAMGM